MYTYTPTSKFLVLLPHTPRVMDCPLPDGAEKATVDGTASPPQSPYPAQAEGRKDFFSTETTASSPNEGPPVLFPGGFLKLGLDAPASK